MVARVLIATALVVVASCEKRSTKYCGLHPEDLANCEQLDAPPPPPVMCMTDAECTGGYCELGAHVCVECLNNTHCDANELCDVNGTFSCRGCIANTDCTGGVCLPGGSCSTDDDVIYVGGGDDTGSCGFASPCATLTYALTQVTAERKTIYYSGQSTESPLIQDMTVDIVASPDALLTGETGPDWAIKIESSIVSITGLTIFCGGGSDQNGVQATMASTVNLDRVDVSGCGRSGGIKIGMSVAKVTRSNIHDNPAGGFTCDNSAEVSLVNNWFHHNGTLTSAYGGVFIDTDMPLGTVKIEFNTIADNASSGLDCDKVFEAPNNVIVGNGTLLENNLINCTPGNSLVAADKTPLAFTNSATGNYHIGATSTAKDAATMTLGIDFDYDGELRPQGTAPDLGADEYK